MVVQKELASLNTQTQKTLQKRWLLLTDITSITEPSLSSILAKKQLAVLASREHHRVVLLVNQTQFSVEI
jgi:hypothetical protein